MAKPASTDVGGLTDRILHGILDSPSPDPSNPRRRYSDADAAELALLDYFLRLGPGRLHLLRPRQPQEGRQAARAPFGCVQPPQATEERSGGLPPPAEARPSCRLDADTVILTSSSETGEEKAAVLKRGKPDSSDPSRFPSSAADERSPESKKPRITPSAANHTGGIGSTDAGVMNGRQPPPAGLGGRGSRQLPPSILCAAIWEEGAGGDEGGVRVRRRHPSPPQAEHEAEGKAPAAGAAARAPRASSPVGRSLPAENARTAASAEATFAEEQGPANGDAGEPSSPSLMALVEETPPSRATGDAMSPSRVGSDVISLSSFINVFLRFSTNPAHTPEDVDPLEALAAKRIQLPPPRWWRPGGYGRQSSPGNK